MLKNRYLSAFIVMLIVYIVTNPRAGAAFATSGGPSVVLTS
ncbi:MAG: hypothetical protein QXV05_06290 [Candidatus Korarchaeum sp.]